MRRTVPILVLALLLSPPLLAQEQVAGWAADPPVLSDLVEFDRGQSDLRVAVDRYAQDRRALDRRYDIPYSPVLRERLERFYRGWLDRLAELDFDSLNHEGQIDYILLHHEIEFGLEMMRQEAEMFEQMLPIVPFARGVQQLQESRRDRVVKLDGRSSAQTLDDLGDAVEAATAMVRSDDAPEVKGVAAARAAMFTDQLRRMLEGWHGFYTGYDPLFTWWAKKPYERLDAALGAHADAIRARYVGDEGVVVGDPIGEAGLVAHLKRDMIPYTADELIRIAEIEFEWMEEALVEASREMGYGDDWKAAQEAVKENAVPPGDKPELIMELERQSIEFIEARDWIDIPPLAHEIWRVQMMSPERQRVNPFFTGGEVISISYPTDTMEHDEKLMSMRGNNPHFNRGTVQHELIPGHHLQGFMTSRFNDHRRIFSTPFWGEGWALYWEMILWEEGFPRGPEDRIGMLFWRMHRAARIIFSLSFHLERMTPQEAVDFLVDRVGHERANAEAEVRRSFNGSYPPLYQAGYMLGGMQFRALHRELVESGQRTARDFHNAVMKGGRMPVEMVRAMLTDQPLSRDFESTWRFADDR
jgi:hypothetical protein